MFATHETVGLAKWIIDNTCLVLKIMLIKSCNNFRLSMAKFMQMELYFINIHIEKNWNFQPKAMAAKKTLHTKSNLIIISSVQFYSS